MADRVILLASTPDEFARGIYVPEEMLSDLIEISRLDQGQADKIATDIEACPGFLDDDRLREIVSHHVENRSASDAILRAIQNIRPDSIEKTLATLRAWRDANPARGERLPDSSLEAIGAILPGVIRSFPALERQRKATRLASLTGNRVRDIEIVCDARPVFDVRREKIEGLLTQTLLKVVYEGQNDEMQCVEFVLTKKHLDDLGKKLDQARQKLEALETAIRAWIPEGFAGRAD